MQGTEVREGIGYTGCKPNVRVFGSQYPAHGHGGIRGEEDATLLHASPTPRAEHRRPSPAFGKRAHRVCILHPGSPAPRPSPIALLPYCLTALLLYCPTALLPPRPPIGLTRPRGLAMMGAEASRDQVPRIGVKRERGANPLRSRRRDRGRKCRYATGSGHAVPPGKAARVGRSGSRKTCLVLLTGLLRGEKP